MEYYGNALICFLEAYAGLDNEKSVAREKSSERDLQGSVGQCENIQDEHVKDS